jgi:hypothetical protein
MVFRDFSDYSVTRKSPAKGKMVCQQEKANEQKAEG